MPDGLFLGGAPLNVAVHLHRLGYDARLVSSVGCDTLGNEIVRRVDKFGLSTEFIQEHAVLETGFVDVDLSGVSPRYDIRNPVAWDEIRWNDAAARVCRSARALVFGSLAQRNQISRATLARLAASCDLLVFDVNIRPPFDNLDVIQKSLEMTDLLKLNDDELVQCSRWFGLSGPMDAQCRQLAERFDIETICLTKGADGAAVLHAGAWYERVARPITAADTVLAGILARLLSQADVESALSYAVNLAALVASRRGATPFYSTDDVAFGESVVHDLKR